jgi:drug/metabolite transporter (DMT)-like permease
MVLLNSLRNRTKPSIGGGFGLLLGFAGVALLVGEIENTANNFMVIPAAAIVLLGAFSWACGSLYSRSAKTSSSQLQSPAMQMIAGGILLLSASLITGEWTLIMLDRISLPSIFSWLYLIIFGSLVGFSSYIWLLKHANLSRVSTHAYVNPLVAVILGWTLAEEALTTSNVLAAIIIILSVAVITTFPAEKEKTASKF